MKRVRSNSGQNATWVTELQEDKVELSDSCDAVAVHSLVTSYYTKELSNCIIHFICLMICLTDSNELFLVVIFSFKM
jgi:hypothetical protein